MDDLTKEFNSTGTAFRRDRRETLIYNLACMMAGLDFDTIPASELRVGDVIAPDGDVIITKPEYIADDDAWVCKANCPNGGDFEVRQAPADVAVFGRA
jgi:hypothetical protein